MASHIDTFAVSENQTRCTRKNVVKTVSHLCDRRENVNNLLSKCPDMKTIARLFDRKAGMAVIVLLGISFLILQMRSVFG